MTSKLMPWRSIVCDHSCRAKQLVGEKLTLLLKTCCFAFDVTHENITASGILLCTNMYKILSSSNVDSTTYLLIDGQVSEGTLDRGGVEFKKKRMCACISTSFSSVIPATRKKFNVFRSVA